MHIFKEAFNRIKASFKSTFFWRLFGVVAMNRAWTKILIAIALSTAIFAAMFGVELINYPIPSLAKMNKTEGMLESVYLPLRDSSYRSKIRLMTGSGDSLQYTGSLDNNERDTLNLIKGEKILVLSRPYYKLWPPFYYQEFWQIETNGRVLYTLEKYRMNKENYYSSVLFYFKKFLGLIFLSVVVIFLACYRDAKYMNEQS